MDKPTDRELIKIVQSLPDATFRFTVGISPSLALPRVSSPEDNRIDEYAAKTKSGFFLDILNDEIKEVVIVNPNKSAGLLWWKKYDRLILKRERLNNIISGKDEFTNKERAFIEQLK